ncbi:MAG: insulinase family protein [Prevotellaceae bacterium]|jgi:zinc protease|nr:insulinase family protein [Prevotellaceae bacterium]
MKKHLLFVTLALAMSAMSLHANAQTLMPVDPAWRTGTLDNGMKYYIRKNATPAGKAGFWIAHDIGSLHETPNQNGLAHFLEHMAFNGLKHFPGKAMLEYMQSIGCAFGANINASTSQQLTQYMLTDVPIHREGIIDTCLLILHDWSGHILCEQEELDAERGVIREEWRNGRTASRRNYQELARTLYSGTPYATRTTIGDTSIINNFTRKEILDFYHEWYRPNLQAVVMVGDFDVDMMERKVKNLFGTLKNPENPKRKADFNVPDNIEPITNIYKESELTTNNVSLYIKFPSKFNKNNRNTEEYVRYNLANGYITAMLNARFSEAARLPGTKFTNASASIRMFVGDRDAFALSVNANNNELSAGFDEALTIVEQARRFGFSPGELERAKANLLQRYESNFAERNNKKHTDYNRSAYSQFQYNTQLMSEEQTLNLVKKLSAGIQLAELNETLKSMIVLGPNTIIYASGPDKAGVSLPDDEMLTMVMYGVAKKQLTPYEDTVTDKPLISQTIKAGKVRKESKNTAMDAVEWTLNNGMKVVLKPTSFKQDEISFSGFGWGGNSVLPDADFDNARYAAYLAQSSGISEFNRTTLSKMLTGKRVRVSPGIRVLTQNINGSCSPKDLETALQLVHLYFTAPRFDQAELDIMLNQERNLLKNRSADPATALNDTINNLLRNYHPRVKAITEDGLDKLSLTKMQEIYKQRFANPGAFTFIFVGNIDLKTAKPLIEKYLGGLTGNKKETCKDNNLYPVKGEVKRSFKRSMQVAKASVRIYYTGELANTLENAMAINYLSRILRLRYTDEIREKRGGTYGASVSGSLSTLPKERYSLSITFDTDPKMMEELVGVAYDELKKIAENGPLAEDFQKAEGNMKSQFEQNQKENNYWSNVLNAYYSFGKDNHTNWQDTFSKTNAKTVQDLAREILKQKNTIEVVMLPE